MDARIKNAPDAWQFATAASGGTHKTLKLGEGLTIEFERWSQGWTFMTFVDDTGRDAKYLLEIKLRDEVMIVQDVVRSADNVPIRHGRRLPGDPELHTIDDKNLIVFIDGTPLLRPEQ